MSKVATSSIDNHEISEWRDRQGNLLGAIVYLSPEELRRLQETGSVELTVAE